MRMYKKNFDKSSPYTSCKNKYLNTKIMFSFKQNSEEKELIHCRNTALISHQLQINMIIKKLVVIPQEQTQKQMDGNQRKRIEERVIKT